MTARKPKPPPLTPWDGITPRQVEILNALTEEGEANESIGQRLGVTSKTVDAHLTRAYAVMGARSRVDAALMWDRWRRKEGAQA